VPSKLDKKFQWSDFIDGSLFEQWERVEMQRVDVAFEAVFRASPGR
jgi:hypothetical protein